MIAFIEKSFKLNCIAILGHSRGANVALRCAHTSLNPHICAVVAIAPRFFMKGALQKHSAADVEAALQQETAFVWNVRARGREWSISVTSQDIRKMLSQQDVNGKKFSFITSS